MSTPKLRSISRAVKFAKIGTVTKLLHAWKPEFGRKYLIDQLTQMPGLPAKVAQVMSMQFNDPSWNKTQIDPMPLEWVKEQIERDAPKLFSELDSLSADAEYASLGQVRWGRLKDGREVAIKIQYPDVSSEFIAQLDFMMDAMDKIPRSEKYGIDVDAYRNFLTRFFESETDYLREASEQAKFRALWDGYSYLVVPSVLKEFCSTKVLVQSFEPSQSLSDIKSLPLEDRLHCAELISKLFLTSIFKSGTVHADFHPRNWGYRKNEGRLVLYDFGAVLMLDSEIRGALTKLAEGSLQSTQDFLHELSVLGFDVQKLAPVADRLPELCWVLFEPVIEAGLWTPSKWNIQSRLDELLHEDKWWFRVAGPPWFLIFMRSILGAAHALSELQVEIPLAQWFFESTGLKAREGSEPTMKAGPSLQKGEGAGTARNLKVRVLNAGVESVMIELPARSVEDLENLVPEEVSAAVKELGVDLIQVKERAIESGLRPQTLFEAEFGEKELRVWLE